MRKETQGKRRHNSLLLTARDNNKWIAEYSKFNFHEMLEQTILNAARTTSKATSSHYKGSAHGDDSGHMLGDIDEMASISRAASTMSVNGMLERLNAHT